MKPIKTKLFAIVMVFTLLFLGACRGPDEQNREAPGVSDESLSQSDSLSQSEAEQPSSSEESSNPPGYIPSDQEMLETGGYIDLNLIQYIGSQNFEDWLKLNPKGTVYDLTRDFNISDEKVKELTGGHIYDAYIKYKPSSNDKPDSIQSPPQQPSSEQQIEAGVATVYIKLSNDTINLNQIQSSFKLPFTIYNESTKEIYVSTAYEIEQFNGTQWLPLTFNEADLPNWESVTPVISAGETLEDNMTYWSFSQAVTPGKYRLVKRVSEENKEAFSIAVDFTIIE